MGLRSIVQEEKEKPKLQATPTRLMQEPAHSPVTAMGHHYRLNSESFALNCQSASQNCRIGGNRDRYSETDLARNFALLLNDLPKS